jgi:hypothetical protein
MTFRELNSRVLAVFLSLLLCGFPQLVAAQSAATKTQQTPEGQTSQDQNPTPAEAQSSRPDPSQAPLAPVPTARPTDTNSVPPDAPSEVQRSQQTQPAATTTQTQTLTQQQPSVPLGTATAQQGATRGGVASRPAGEAIAPAKQRQVHSMLIKVALLAAGAAAVGTVVGLTRSTSSIPPGAH